MNPKDLSQQDREFCERQERSTLTGHNGVCRHIEMTKRLDSRDTIDAEVKHVTPKKKGNDRRS